MGLTRRKQADMRTAVEITGRFRSIAPEDPVRYDFALTRLGIREGMDVQKCRRDLGAPAPLLPGGETLL